MTNLFDHFGARAKLPGTNVYYYRLDKLNHLANIDRLPFSIKIMLEALLRTCDGYVVTPNDVEKLARYNAKSPVADELPFKPGRVILQDFTGVPAVVDLAAMRAAMARLGGNPKKINPIVPVDLVIDHSVQVDAFGSAAALFINAEKEFVRNRERYEFLKWGQKAFENFTVVPPATGIVHQVNLEYLGKVVMTAPERDGVVAFPDSLVGTDSHTTMIDGLGVLAWGVGGIEAEAVMLGQPIYMLTPEVIGVRLTGRMPEGSTATDLVLVVTQMLRQKGVVGKFVEFFGPGLSSMTLADRATIANMCPEYGATVGFFPVDEETLRYLRQTGRPSDLIDLVEKYSKAQGLFRTDDTPDPDFTDVVELDLGTVLPSLAGPKRPQDRILVSEMKEKYTKMLLSPAGPQGIGLREEELGRTAVVRNGHETEIGHGAVVIAAITSCTNTSNPYVMLGAGLVAKKAVEAGLTVPPYVKTSLAPGSRVVENYLKKAGLMPYLEQLGFHIVGFGCTTCIGNSGPLPEAVEAAIREGDLVASAVLSGNRNFEGRVHPLTKTNYLASPPLVVAFALAGRTDIDLTTEPIGTNQDGQPVYLRDIWPSSQEVAETVAQTVTAAMFREQYANIYDGNEEWNKIPVRGGELYEWNPDSTYIQEPPFFTTLTPEIKPISNIENARVLVKVGDSVTTDHISPAGSISRTSPAGQYLLEHDVEPPYFNSYGSRRGNDRVMTRGTFANVRLRNQMAPGTEGGFTTYLPTNEVTTIYDASLKYQAAGTPLVVLAGNDYGMGSSRDWAAKGVLLLGVRLVIAQSYERIHRSNLVGMGVLPLQFMPGENPQTLGLDGTEMYSTLNLTDEVKPLQEITVRAERGDGTAVTFQTLCRIDTPVEVDYYRNGGILHTVLRNFLKE
ncbi:MAG: aconitate hydratase AcnA [Chloroflexi bacterium]|nr:aconitate hydratase AcnA [Ardenticatenaceae bacterium]MBL1131483.1 aconitate hydratase AcnA [Chloroflexota bacterium]NOG37594.1 aconitate hydratase AcnA [Chloroflexota bacterium]GIK57393.1 MAG: aconitate hydratase [Chloroflexota bacterium]